MQTTLLPDGSTITLKGVTYGKKHYAPGKPWERLWAFLPKPLATRFGLNRPAAQTTDMPTLVFWFEWRGHAPGPQNLECALTDEDGFESRIDGFNYSSFINQTASLLGRGSTAFPRRAKIVRVRLYSRDSNWRRIRAAEFVVRNPARDVYPVWTPEPIPAAKTEGDLQFTLTELSVPRSSGPRFQPGTMAEELSATARFRIADKGKATTDWEIIKITMTDATGNRVSSSSWSNENKTGEELFRYNPTLWSDEAAWKLGVEFSRKPDAPFAADEVWTIPGVAVPGASSYTELNRTNTLQGCSVHFIGLAGEFGRLPNGNNMSSGSGNLQVNVSPMPDGMRLTLVSVVDDQARPVNRQGASWGGGKHSFGLKWPSDAKTVDIKLALHKSRFAEYLVKPDAAPVNSSPNRK